MPTSLVHDSQATSDRCGECSRVGRFGWVRLVSVSDVTRDKCGPFSVPRLGDGVTASRNASIAAVRPGRRCPTGTPRMIGWCPVSGVESLGAHRNFSVYRRFASITAAAVTTWSQTRVERSGDSVRRSLIVRRQDVRLELQRDGDV